MSSKNGGGSVYSTQFGALCPRCENPVKDCSCAFTSGEHGRPGVVRVARETKGRKGKGVSLVSGVPLVGEELTRLAKELKKKCGSGGTLRAGVIEIQGDHRDKLVLELEKKGWSVKRVGG
jgi:translation initiation factor 1